MSTNDRAWQTWATGDQGLHARVSGGVESAPEKIKEHMEAAGVSGAGAAQIAAHQTREGKQHLSHEESRGAHQKMAVEYGQQPHRVLAETA